MLVWCWMVNKLCWIWLNMAEWYSRLFLDDLQQAKAYYHGISWKLRTHWMVFQWNGASRERNMPWLGGNFPSWSLLNDPEQTHSATSKYSRIALKWQPVALFAQVYLLEMKLSESNEQWSKHCVWGSQKSPRGFRLSFPMVITRKCQHVQHHLQPQSLQPHRIPFCQSHIPMTSRCLEPTVQESWKSIVWLDFARKGLGSPRRPGEDSRNCLKRFPPHGSIASCVNRDHQAWTALQWTNETSLWEMGTQNTVTCLLQ